MTVQEAGKKWGYSRNHTERLRKMLLEMPEKYPLVAGHLVIPDESPKIFVPDNRSRNTKGYVYRFILDAIGINSLLYPETIGINDDILKASLEELLDNNEIRRVNKDSSTWETTDFILCRNRIWAKKSAEEKRKYVAELIEHFKPISIL